MKNVDTLVADDSPKLERDVFEFKDEFKKRLEQNGPYLAGTASLLKDKYDIEAGSFPLEIQWKDWLNPLNPITNGFYIIAKRDFAKELYESSMNHTITVHLTVISEKVIIHRIILSGVGEYFTVKQIEDEASWEKAQEDDTLEAYHTYLSGYTFKKYREEALIKYEDYKTKKGEQQHSKIFEFDIVTVNAMGEIINTEQTQTQYHIEDLGNGVTLEMVDIPGGTFIMGSATEPEQDEDESPEHEVTVKSFYLSKYPITQTQWKAVMGNNPSFFKGDTRPVERVLWHDTLKFYKRLSEITGRAYRLPSEAEWEYACRANTTTYFHYGDVVNAELVNYNAKNESKGIYLEETSNVGSFSPNAFGLYDMHGNVYEWCADPWHENYDGAPSFARVWEEGGVSSKRILRGGSWLSTQWYCRSTTRNWLSTVNLYDNVGFRVALIANAWCST